MPVGPIFLLRAKPPPPHGGALVRRDGSVLFCFDPSVLSDLFVCLSFPHNLYPTYFLNIQAEG